MSVSDVGKLMTDIYMLCIMYVQLYTDHTEVTLEHIRVTCYRHCHRPVVCCFAAPSAGPRVP